VSDRVADRDEVIVVDEYDRAVGVAPKLAAHRDGALHRAVSVFVTDGAGSVLLQRRALAKYHSGGLWSNSCCGHPRPGESVADAATRRLVEEMGIRCSLEPAGAFRYRAELPNGFIEHEIVHVFVGRWDGEPTPDPAEVGAWRWATVAELGRETRERPDQYTVWLADVLSQIRSHRLVSGA
jgi:isopentenyl-diphosphate delta-isomerase